MRFEKVDVVARCVQATRPALFFLCVCVCITIWLWNLHPKILKKKEKKKSRLSLFFSPFLFIQESHLFFPRRFQKRKMERRGSTQRLDDEMFLKEKKKEPWWLSSLMSTGHCTTLRSYKRVGILPSSFACRTRAQEEEYHPAATSGPLLFFISLDLSGCWSRWFGFIFQEIIYLFRSTAVVVLGTDIRHFSGVWKNRIRAPPSTQISSPTGLLLSYVRTCIII